MNKTVIYIGFISLIALSLIEALVLLWFAPEHFATFTSYIAIALGLATTFAVTLWQLKQHRDDTNAKLDVVQKQTNGTLSKAFELIEEKNDTIRKKDRRIADLEASLLHRPKKGSIE